METSIKDLYEKLGSIRKVSIALNLSRDYISKLLREEGIVTDKKRKIRSEDELIMKEMYVKDGKTLKEIASYFDIEYRQVSSRLKKLGVKIRANLPYNFPEEVYEEWAEYYHLGYSYYYIAETYSVSKETVRDYLQNKKGIPSHRASKIFEEDTYTLWIEFYESGATLEEIAEDFDVSKSTVAKHLEKRDVKRRNGFKYPEDIHDEWIELYDEGFSTREIGNLYNVSKYCIGWHLKRKKVRLRESWEWNLSKPELLNVDPSFEQKQVILGSALGDGTLFDQEMGAYLRIKHKIGQKEYLEYKKGILGEFVSNSGLVHTETEANDKTFQQVYCCTVPNMYIKMLRNLSYSNGLRIITELIHQLEALGLAILWCDDGNYTKQKSGKLSTNNFSWNDNELLALHMQEKFRIECYVKKQYSKEYDKIYPIIYITTAGMETMKELIKNYVPPSMKYKIGE